MFWVGSAGGLPPSNTSPPSAQCPRICVGTAVRARRHPHLRTVYPSRHIPKHDLLVSHPHPAFSSSSPFLPFPPSPLPHFRLRPFAHFPLHHSFPPPPPRRGSRLGPRKTSEARMDHYLARNLGPEDRWPAAVVGRLSATLQAAPFHITTPLQFEQRFTSVVVEVRSAAACVGHPACLRRGVLGHASPPPPDRPCPSTTALVECVQLVRWLWAPAVPSDVEVVRPTRCPHACSHLKPFALLPPPLSSCSRTHRCF
jgi:hypothetical protein